MKPGRIVSMEIGPEKVRIGKNDKTEQDMMKKMKKEAMGQFEQKRMNLGLGWKINWFPLLGNCGVCRLKERDKRDGIVVISPGAHRQFV